MNRMLDPPEAEEVSYAVLINLAEDTATFDLTKVAFFPPTATVIVRSTSAEDPSTAPG
jgi:hypothetical protein